MVHEEPIKARRQMLLVARVRDYNQLLKRNLSLMIAFSSVIGYLLAPGTYFNWQALIILFAGGMLVTGGANTINQILERESDALMSRTRMRPLPEGRMSVAEAWIFAAATGIAGALLLGVYFNAAAGLLSFASLILYAFVYTPMKKVHPISVLLGAIPGALPPLIGWVAATGSFTMGGWVIFLIQFFWQFPHFWAIAWVAFDDYSKAGIRMLPTRERETRYTGKQCMIYSLVLIPMAIIPYKIGLTGSIGMWVCVAGGIFFFVASVSFFQKNNHKSAKQLMYASFIYLPTVLLALVLDSPKFV